MIGDQQNKMDFARRLKIKGYLFSQNKLFKFVKNEIKII